jgi:glycosyltransferase involved in cell wall biosynthesis
MKILHVIPSIAPVRGGASRAIIEMVQALRKYKKVDAEIATTNDNGDLLLDVPLGRSIEYDRVPVYFFSRFTPAIKSLREYNFSSQFTIWLWQNCHKYDLLHIHAIFSYTSTVAMFIARIKNIPYIVTPHGLLCDWSLQQSAFKKRLYLSLSEKANLNNSQVLHLTTKQESHEVAKLNLKSPDVVIPLGLASPNIIPNARFQLRKLLKVPDDEPLVLFMSRLHHKKGLDYLIPALGKLSCKRFTFILAGSGASDYEKEVEALLLSAGIKHRTHRVGFVKGEMKNLLLQGSDLFALTSHSENFGVAVLEALAAGLPVLISPGVALASVVNEHQLGYVTDLDVEVIALALQQCLSDLGDHQKTEARRKRANQLILEQYTWESIAAKMSDFYEKFVNKHKINNL